MPTRDYTNMSVPPSLFRRIERFKEKLHIPSRTMALAIMLDFACDRYMMEDCGEMSVLSLIDKYPRRGRGWQGTHLSKNWDPKPPHLWAAGRQPPPEPELDEEGFPLTQPKEPDWP